MKRIGAFSLAIFIFVLSVFSVVPVDVYADDDKTVLPFTFKQLNHSVGAGMSASDAKAAVTAHKDIYTSDGTLLFIYNPSNSYNWTTSTAAYYVTLNYSDEQLKNILMSKNPLMTLFSVSQALANNNGIRAFCAGLGTIFSGSSDMGTKVLDTITGNYNYLDALNYDEDSQTITLSNDNGSVDKLREEIKNYYYISNGMFYLSSVGELSSAISTSNYSDMSLYQEDFNIAMNYDYIFKQSSDLMVAFKSSDISYFYYTNAGASYDDSYKSVNPIQFVDTKLNSVSVDTYAYSGFNFNDDKDYSFYELYLTYTGYNQRYNIFDSIKRKPYWDIFGFGVKDNETEKLRGISGYYNHASLYSKDKKNLLGFISYEALYNYVHGDQNAYLSSKIEETGKDISYSIKNMNENLGDKMDQLIDSINSGKGSMTSDELQNAIDKGLEDLNKNTEDIKDNTSSILDKLEEQNQILLQILGVTEFIAYQEVKENSDQYNMSYLKTLLDSMFTGLFNALMYGENTVDDKNTDTASMQSFSVSNAAAPVAVYSDDIAVYDSSGSGGGSSFGGGSGSSSGHFFDLKNGLFGKFPFSIPYQCYNWLQILQRDPEAPTFTLDYGYLFGAAGAPEYVLTFDLSRYNDIAEVGRSFCRLFMTLMLALGIYHKNKGEM